MTKIIGGGEEIFTPSTHQSEALATSVGLPDDKDVENILRAIKQYEIARPGELKLFMAQAKKEQAQLDNDFGSNAAAHTETAKRQFRRALTMPIGLYRMIDEAYPLMFNDKKHLHWFMRKFPKFCIARKV